MSHYILSEPMVTGCSVSMIRKIVDMRRCGLPYKTIAHKIGVHKQTVNRWHRVYEKFGEEAFAGSFEDV